MNVVKGVQGPIVLKKPVQSLVKVSGTLKPSWSMAEKFVPTIHLSPFLQKALPCTHLGLSKILLKPLTRTTMLKLKKII